MRRREFITLLGGAAVVWPMAARAQQAIPVIGYLGSETPELFASRLHAFRSGLSSTGFEEGRNVVIEYRWAKGHNDRLPTLAADLVNRNVAVIATPGSVAAALVAKASTTTIPIVFETGSDPVVAGLIASLNKPGGNITGVTSLNIQIGPKRLELLRELAPEAKIFALLVNPKNPKNAEATTKDLQIAARMLNLQLHILNASADSDFDRVFASLKELRVKGLVIASEIYFSSRTEQLGALAARYAIPAVHQSREFVLAGGLISYGGNFAESHRLAGIYTGRILNGDNVSNLPVQQVTKVEFIINLKAAKTLGITVPVSMLGRADEVIE